MRQSSQHPVSKKVRSAIISGILVSAVLMFGSSAPPAYGSQTAKQKPLVAKPVQRPVAPVVRPQPATRPAPQTTSRPAAAPAARPQPAATANRTPQPATRTPQPAATRPVQPAATKAVQPSATKQPRTPASTTATAHPAEPAKSREPEKTPTRTASNEPKETPKIPSATKPVRPVTHVTEKDSKGHVTGFKTDSGTIAKVNPKTGKVTSLRKVGADGSVTSVHTSPSGVRNVETVRKDNYGHSVKIVSHGGTGYQERDLQRRQGFKQRTYYDRNGHTTVRVYQNVSYGRYGSYPVFVPDHYYHPGFYAYVGSPFPAAVAFSWGPHPAYAAYGPYFRPAPSYGSPAAFIADYSIGANLSAAAGGPPPSGMPGGMPGNGGPGYGPGGQPGGGPVSQPGAQPGGAFPSPGDDPNGAMDSTGPDGQGTQPEPSTGDPQPIPDNVRNEYVQQVQGQIKTAQAQASGQEPTGAPGALDPNFKIFQSYSDVQADLNGQQCALTGGDFVQREEDTPDANSTVAVTVVTIAKPTASHCEEHAKVRLPVETLQDWYNSYLESQQQGFAAMAANQGKGGFPPATDVATNANPLGQGTPDDPHALAGAIQQQQTDATAIQAEVQPGGGQ